MTQQEREAFCAQHGHIFFTNHPGFVTTEKQTMHVLRSAEPAQDEEDNQS